MADSATSDKNTQAVEHVVKLEEYFRQSMDESGRTARYKSALNAFMGRGLVINPEGVNVKLNRLRSDVETLAARFAQYLLGERPYFPIEAKNTKDSAAKQEAKLRERVLDDYLESQGLDGQGNFYAASFYNYIVLLSLGKSFMEPRWGMTKCKYIRREPQMDPIFGTYTGVSEEVVEVEREGIIHVPRRPWEVLEHPWGETLSQKPAIIIKEVLPVEEIERLLEDETHPMKLPANVDRKRLKQGPQMQGMENFMQQWRREVGASGESNVGIFLRCYHNPTVKHPKGRWTFCWNYDIALMDTENLNKNMALTQKPVIGFYDLQPPSHDRDDGLGHWDRIGDKIELRDAIMSTWLNDLFLTLNPQLAYDPDVFEADSLNSIIGGRIPMQDGASMIQGFDPNKAVFEIPRSRPGSENLEAADRLAQESDYETGLGPYLRGEETRRKETFGTNQMLSGAADSRLEARIKRIEQTSLAEYGLYCLKLIDANANYEDLEAVLGDDAVDLWSLDPETMAGGYKFAFQGAARITQKQKEVEALKEYANLYQNDPGNAAPWIIKRKVAVVLGQFDDDEVEAMYPDPSQQMMDPNAMADPMAQGGAGAPMDSLGETQAINDPTKLSSPATNQALATGA